MLDWQSIYVISTDYAVTIKMRASVAGNFVLGLGCITEYQYCSVVSVSIIIMSSTWKKKQETN